MGVGCEAPQGSSMPWHVHGSGVVPGSGAEALEGARYLTTLHAPRIGDRVKVRGHLVAVLTYLHSQHQAHVVLWSGDTLVSCISACLGVGPVKGGRTILRGVAADTPQTHSYQLLTGSYVAYGNRQWGNYPHTSICRHTCPLHRNDKPRH